MDTFSFIASLVSSLAWPTAVLIIVFILRQPITALLPFLDELKYKDFSLKFKRELESIDKEIIEVLPAESQPALPAPEENLLELSAQSPTASIIIAWKDLEQSMLNLLERKGIQRAGFHRGIQKSITGQLSQLELVPKDILDAVNRCRQLRNQAAHSNTEWLSPAMAIDYINTTQRLVNYLNNI